MKLLLVGCGAMGSALLRGWLNTNALQEVSVISPHLENADQFPGISFFHDLNEIDYHDWDIILFAVKPKILPNILHDYRKFIGDKTIFVSIAAALTLQSIQEGLGENARCARVMPNTPVIINKGVCGILMPGASSAEKEKLSSLFSCLGDTVWLKTDHDIDAITAVSGCGPAYVFHMIEALTEAAESLGFTDEQALKLAKGTLWGASNYAHDANETPEQLRINVTSPGGMTEAALTVLMGEGGLKPLIKKTLEAAMNRSEEMRSHG